MVVDAVAVAVVVVVVVAVGVAVAIAVGVGIAVGVAVAVAVGIGIVVGVGIAAGVGIAVVVGVADAVVVAVVVAVMVAVGVAVELGKQKENNMPAKKKQQNLSANPTAVGNAVHIRTVTHYYTGRIIAIEDDHIVLEDAAWIAWTAGRFHDVLRTGIVTDIEPFCHAVAIGRGAIVDVTHWPHPLPREQR